IQPRATLLIDLEPPLEEIMASFEEKTRYNIRLAEKKGVKVKAMPNEEGVRIFYKIYQETAKRDGFLIHPIDYYLKIFEQLVNNGMGVILVAFYEDEPIAAIFNFCLGKKTWYMYGSSSKKNRNVMPNHALHWDFIKWAKGTGYKTYDLWGIPANPAPGHPLWGVYRFKKGFSSNLVKWMGAYDLPLNRFYYQLFDKGMKVWQSVRSLIKKGRIIDSLSE
ncbi:MAG: peptidoglycan bridge formation glycyltransferase FemA/FemB family protein, partial [bacterium]